MPIITSKLPLRYKETNLFTGSSFGVKVFEVVHTHQPILKLHWHDYLELLYFVGGDASITIGTSKHEVSTGDILFVNCRHMHSGYSIDNSPVKYYAIVIDPLLFSNDMGDPCYKKYILPYFDGRQLFTTKPGKNTPYYKKLRNHVKNIIKEHNDTHSGYEIKIKTHIYSLIVDFIRSYFPIDQPNTPHSDNITDEEKSVKNLVSYIYLTCPRKMTLTEAAEYVKLSPFYFCKVFKKVTNKTFIEFLNGYRITRAEDFLLYTNDSISDISSDLGFCNTNYFDKVFRKYKGCSPSAFRKQMSK